MAIITGDALNNILVGTGLNDIISGLGGNDQLFGLGGNDRLNGGTGNDILNGGSGADVLDGGTGNDRMTGGTGNDTYFVDSALDRVIELAGLGQGIDTIAATISINLGAPGYANVENVALQGVRDLSAFGNAQNNVLTGNAGDNTLFGFNGNDALRGGAGADFIFGGFGNDVIDGGTGADTMQGQQGNDTYVVDNAGDRVIEVFGQGNDTIVSLISTTLNVNGRQAVENLTLAGSAVAGFGNGLSNIIIGTNGGNVLRGFAGNDTINGLGGDDALLGDTGSDLLNGGLGNDDITTGTGFDTIRFDSVLNGTTNVDDVFDFNPIFDTFQLENTGVGLFTGLANGVLAAADFFIGIQASDLTDRIIYNNVTGNIYFDQDGSLGNIGQVLFAHVDPGTALTAADFVVV